MHLFKRTHSVAVKIKNVRWKSSVSFEEVNIPVPWGYLAGKWWGVQDRRPILTLHGWMDTCESFDPLIPLLPQNVGYLALDLPGHGYSSKLPPGMFYGNITAILTIKIIKEFFKWNTVTLLTHSFSTVGSYNYGSLYPETVDYLIGFDPMQMLRTPANKDTLRQKMDDFLKYDKLFTEKSTPPSYTIKEMAERMHKGNGKSIDLDKCEIVLKRNIIPDKNKKGYFCFNMDPRLKVFEMINWSLEQHKEAVKNITFPMMITSTHREVDYAGHKIIVFIDVLKESKWCEPKFLEGMTHHAHLNNPEVFAKLVAEFMEKHEGKVDRKSSFDVSTIRK